MGIWLKRLSYLAILGFPLSVLGARIGLFHFRVGFQGLRYTVILALVILVAAIITAFRHRHSDPTGARAARLAALLCLLPIFVIASQMLLVFTLPAIHNISTDTIDPPRFVILPGLRSAQDNELRYDKQKLAAIQSKAYPAVTTLYSDLSKPTAHAHALVVAKSLGWDIVEQNVATGMIEATETTRLWAFKDDIAIRVREQEGRVAIDLHSVSRVGQSDLGANAKRIKKFIAAFKHRGALNVPMSQ